VDGKREDFVIENIKSRRSIRNFQDRPIPDDVVDKIVEAGRFAPSALNRQPWKFIVIRDRKVIDELSGTAYSRIKRLYPLLGLLGIFKRSFREERFKSAMKKTVESTSEAIFYRAPLVIIIANDTSFDNTQIDCSLAAQNMMLAANSLGIGSCFVGRGRAIPKRFLQKKFDLPPRYDFNVWVVFGYTQDTERSAPPRREDAVKKV